MINGKNYKTEEENIESTNIKEDNNKNNNIKQENIKKNNNKQENNKNNIIKQDNNQENNIEKTEFKEKEICNYDGCQRKLKLTDQQCKCGKKFCRFHKFSEDHKCDYNYKSQEIKDNDIKLLECRPTKIHKIN